MGLLVCNKCTTRYAMGLPYCPHCTSTDYREDTGDMPKSTVHHGASNADANPPVGYTLPSGQVVGEDTKTSEALTTETPDPGSADVDEGRLDGTIEDVLAYVGDDPAKAARALELERERDKPRSTLVAELERRKG